MSRIECKCFKSFVRLQNSRFRKAGSAVSVILECEAREPFTRSSLSFEYGPSLAFAKNTAVLQSSLLFSLISIRFGSREVATKKARFRCPSQTISFVYSTNHARMRLGMMLIAEESIKYRVTWLTINAHGSASWLS